MCILNVSLYKIFEETRPFYYTLSIGLIYIIFDIYSLIITFIKRDQKIDGFFSYQDILLKIIHMLGFCIYSEIIILNFCGLDQNTYEKIIERSKEEILGLTTSEDKLNYDIILY